MVAALAAISLAVNLLVLASPIYMMQVFDRAVVSRSLETLAFLTLIALVALAVMGGLDYCRVLVLARLGDWLERRLGARLMRASLDLSARPGTNPMVGPLRDVGTVRQFLTGPGPGAIFDAPWIPAFLGVIWLIHPLLAAVALAGALLLFSVAVATELSTRGRSESVNERKGDLDRLAETAVQNADVAQSMGLAAALSERWQALHVPQSEEMTRLASRLGGLAALSKALRLALQVAILGTGAYLVIRRQLSPGQMIAASIIMSRAMAPVEIAIGAWRSLVLARASWRRIKGLLAHLERRPQGLALPRPEGRLKLDNVTLVPGNGGPPIVQGVRFELAPGDCLGVVGASAAGKSTLARLLVGSWLPTAGTLELDGADLSQWSAESLGQHVGYLPQSVELFPGEVRQNVSRFREAPLEQVIEAARLAGAHEMILGLPRGYASQVGYQGTILSGGQRQRVGLARAVFGDPRLVVLDEPNSNLDQDGEKALLACLATLKERGVTTVLIAHRRTALGLCSKLLWLEAGKMVAFGPTAEVMEHLQGQLGARLRAIDSRGAEHQ